MCTLCKDSCTFLIVYRSFLLRRRNVSHKCYTDNQNSHFMSIKLFFLNPAVYEIMWKNTVQTDRPQITIWRLCITCCITKYANKHTHTHKHTHTKYVIIIVFPLQQWLDERASTSRFRTLLVLCKTEVLLNNIKKISPYLIQNTNLSITRVVSLGYGVCLPPS